MTKEKASKTAVVFFRGGVFYFYPKKVVDGCVRVFDGRNHFIGSAPVKSSDTIIEDVERWLCKRIATA